MPSVVILLTIGCQLGALVPDFPLLLATWIWKWLSKTSWPMVYDVEACQGVSLKLKMHPPDEHPLAAPPFCALAYVHSVAPPLALGLKMSLTAEHGVDMLVERTGPAFTVPKAPALSRI